MEETQKPGDAADAASGENDQHAAPVAGDAAADQGGAADTAVTPETAATPTPAAETPTRRTRGWLLPVSVAAVAAGSLVLGGVGGFAIAAAVDDDGGPGQVAPMGGQAPGDGRPGADRPGAGQPGPGADDSDSDDSGESESDGGSNGSQDGSSS